MQHTLALVTALVAILATASCTPCDRAGCDGYRRKATASVQGVAGLVAYASDSVANGCQECALAQSILHVWKADGPIATATAAATLVAAAPTATVNANEHYQLQLAPADYLLCVAPGNQPCAALSVSSGAATTVNVKLRYGPTSLRVFDGGSSSPRAETSDFSAP